MAGQIFLSDGDIKFLISSLHHSTPTNEPPMIWLRSPSKWVSRASFSEDTTGEELSSTASPSTIPSSSQPSSAFAHPSDHPEKSSSTPPSSQTSSTSSTFAAQKSKPRLSVKRSFASSSTPCTVVAPPKASQASQLPTACTSVPSQISDPHHSSPKKKWTSTSSATLSAACMAH